MIRVGILGAGGMGNVHARHYKNIAGIEVRFYDPDLERSDAFENRHDLERLDSQADLLSWADVADVCLPTDLHCSVGLAALAAGKHVFMEKPMAGNLGDAKTLVDAAAHAGTVFMPGQVVRFFREYRAAHDAVMKGMIGTPGAVRMRRGGLAPAGGAGNWFMDHHRSGGVLIDLAIHEFDWLRWTFGEVRHLYSRSVGAKSMQGPDYALTTLTFESGVVAHVESTWMDPSGFRATFEVCGSEGMIEHDSRLVATLRTHAGGKSMNEGPLAPSDDPFFCQLSAFIDAVRTQSPPPVSASEGASALAIALAARESAQTDRVVVPERF